MRAFDFPQKPRTQPTPRQSRCKARSMFVLVLVPVSLGQRIVWDRLDHSELLLERLVRKRRPRDVIEWKLGVRDAVEKVAQQGQAAKRLVVVINEGPRRII